MNQDNVGVNSNFDKSINPEQFDQVVEAILAGKYSWACVLMLRFAGYNALHYIPYRTYNRLLKENSPANKSNQQNQDKFQATKTASPNNEKNLSPSCLNKIKDLAYLEAVGKQKTEIRGGSLDDWLSVQMIENQSIKSEPEPEVCLRYCEFN
jgi:hypothetical protein